MVKWIRADVMVAVFLLTGNAMAELPAHLREGTVVWESNRTGAWRIFTRQIGGGESRQVSPDEAGRNHFAAHISPDGKQIVYLSYPSGMDGYRKQGPDVVLPLLIQDLDPGAEPRVLVDNARPYGEHRCAVWLDDGDLIYLDRDYYPHRLDMRTGRAAKLLAERPSGQSWDLGYLIDPTFRYATSGVPSFFRYDKASQTLSARERMDGCQPYFTYDGVWGYWMAGMGGPINRYHLASGRIGSILAKHDRRMPADRAYLYFPHVSRCGRAIVFGASPDQHNHNRGDYALFVAPLDPVSLELAGTPVRLTTYPTTDRFPEILITPLALGRHEGKAPLSVRMKPEPPGEWTWRVNGLPARGNGRFVFREPGTYAVEAERNGVVRRGLAIVAPALPPELVAAVLSRDGWVTLVFNEPVSLNGARFSLSDSGRPQRVEHSAGDTRVRLLTARAPEGPVTLHIAGVRDEAVRPNLMPPLEITLEASTWPVNPEGLVLVWESGDGLRQLHRPGGRTPGVLNLEPAGRARWTAHKAMRLDGGSFIAHEAAGPLLEWFHEGGEITLEAVIHARNTTDHGPARIVSFSTDVLTRNFTLGQEREHFVLRLRTPRSGANAAIPQLALGPVDTQRPVHLLVTYRPGLLVAYMDGQESARSTALDGDFRNWSPHTLVFGAEADGGRDWSGVLEGVAIYRRFMEADEAAANALKARARIQSRPEVPVSVVEARLVEATPVPSLETIAPYRSIMVAHAYTPVRMLEGSALPDPFRVYHWGLLDAQRQPLPTTESGAVVRLRLEPFEAHRHLHDIFPADTLEPDLDAVLYLDVGL